MTSSATTDFRASWRGVKLPDLAQPPKVDPCISPEGQRWGGGVAGQGAVPGEFESPGWGQGYAPCHQCSPAPFPDLWGLLPPIFVPGPDLCTPPLCCRRPS